MRLANNAPVASQDVAIQSRGEKWYSNRLKHGLDSTWHVHEAFADLMVQEEKFPGSTDLPRHVVKYAQRVFSTNNTVPDSAIERIKAVV